jgi:hypothetical protein
MCIYAKYSLKLAPSLQALTAFGRSFQKLSNDKQKIGEEIMSQKTLPNKMPQFPLDGINSKSIKAVRKALKHKNFHKGLSYESHIKGENGVTFSMMTLNNLPIEHALQIDAMFVAGWGHKGMKAGQTFKAIAEHEKVPVVFYAHKQEVVLAVGSIALLPMRDPRMGFSVETAMSVLEFGNMYTATDYRQCGLSAKLTELRLTKGIEIIKQLLQQAIDKKIRLSHKYDRHFGKGEDSSAKRILELLESEHAVIRAIFENTDFHLEKTIEKMGKMGFRANDAALRLMNRQIQASGYIVTTDEPNEGLLETTLMGLMNNRQEQHEQQVVVYGTNSADLLTTLYLQLVNGATLEDNLNNGVKAGKNAKISVDLSLENLRNLCGAEVVFDHSGLKVKDLKAANEALQKEAKTAGKVYLALQPKEVKVVVAWGLQRVAPEVNAVVINTPEAAFTE